VLQTDIITDRAALTQVHSFRILDTLNSGGIQELGNALLKYSMTLQ